MFEWLRKAKARSSAPASDGGSSARSAALPADQISWRTDANLPIPNWQAQGWPETADSTALHAHANALAAAWLDELAKHLARPYQRAESANFMLLSALNERSQQALLKYFETSRRRILATLAGIASDAGYGKTVVLVLDAEESYYRYIANYGSESSEPEAFSAGMFVDAGYGHFVFGEGPFEVMEPIVVHELTHCLVRHLEIPAWLNEGLAVNTEQRFAPRRARYEAAQLAYMFGRYWNESTIQEFWRGKSFLRPDDGQPLSYELARILVQLLDKDYDVLARFCALAKRDDAGEGAATQVLGAGLANLAEIVLGPGAWEPQPQAWASGTERGQFGGW